MFFQKKFFLPWKIAKLSLFLAQKENEGIQGNRRSICFAFVASRQNVLVPTAEWVFIKTRSNKAFRVPQCTENEAQVLALAAKSACEVWQNVNNRPMLLKKLAESLENLTEHFAGLFPPDFENPQNDIQTAVAILNNAKQESSEESPKILAFLPAQKTPFAKLAQFLTDYVLNGNVAIIKPAAPFSAAFLAFAELSVAVNFPSDVLQILLGGDSAILGLAQTEMDAFVIADAALKNKIQQQMEKPCLMI